MPEGAFQLPQENPVLIQKPADIPPSEITPESLYRQRRRFMGGLAQGATAALLSPLGGLLAGDALAAPATPPAGGHLDGIRRATVPGPFATDEALTPRESITTYCNYYEFGPDKSEPAQNAPGRLRTRPWTVVVEGEVLKPRTFGIDDLLRLAPLEERIYRLRCVEGWSMVVPWVGYPLAALLNQVQPTGQARFVEFQTLADPGQMPALASHLLDWPYREGLRLDEAMHPLTLLAVGLYGDVLPAQNGAPIRLVVPWKYGFKSAKSLVRIRLTREQPATAWNLAAPREYGFYSNVNPEVDHPRWSQKNERRLGELWRRKTLPFNGYGDQVASLYAGMDLRRQF